jgi:hypothetical protein
VRASKSKIPVYGLIAALNQYFMLTTSVFPTIMCASVCTIGMVSLLTAFVYCSELTTLHLVIRYTSGLCTMQINHPAYLAGVERSGIGKDGVFCADYVTMVRTVSNKLTRDMVNMSKCGVASQITPGILNCRDIKKEQLTEWLYTASYLLDRCCLPLIQ